MDGYDGFGEGSSTAGRQPTGNLTKRGTRACVNCRKGKNRCEGWEDPPCRRCRASGTVCVFEKPEKSSLDDVAIERVNSLESKVTAMQGTIVNLDTKLDRLLGAFSASPPAGHFPPASPVSPASGVGRQNQAGVPVIDPALEVPLRSGSSGHSTVLPHSLLQLGPGGFPTTLDEAPPPSRGWMVPPVQNRDSVQWDHHVAPPAPAPRAPSGMMSPTPSASAEAFSGRRMSTQAGLAPPTIPMPSPPNPTADMPRASKRARVAAPHDPSPQSTSAIKFPPLPKYPATTHPMQRYGLGGTQTASNSDDEEELVPSSSLTAPFEALAEAAAAAAAEVATDGTRASSVQSSSTPRRRSRSKKRGRRRMPPPPNFFPHVVTKGIISDSEARELIAYYFEHCNDHLPFFDPSYDTYDSLYERTPFSFNSICMTALRSQAGSGPSSRTFLDVSEEARGIARSTLFSPTVRVEGVQAVLVQAAWTEKGYLATGHAMRMGMELGVHRALSILRSRMAAPPSAFDAHEERLLVVSARVWLALYIQDHSMSRGTGRPMMLRDSERPTVADCQALLDHRMRCPTDYALAAVVDFVGHYGPAIDYFGRFSGERDLPDEADRFVSSVGQSLRESFEKWDGLLGAHFSEDHFQRVNLQVNWLSARTFLACTALQGRLSSDAGLSPRIKSLVVEARSASTATIRSIVGSPAYRRTLRSAPYTTINTLAFSALLALKMTKSFYDGGAGAVDLAKLVADVLDLSNVLAECPQAERFCVTIRIALEKFKRHFGGDEMFKAATGAAADDRGGGATVGGVEGFTNGLTQQDGSSLFDFDLNNLMDLVPNDWVESLNNPSMPDWLHSGDPLSLDFPSVSLDNLFLPSWSLERGGGSKLPNPTDEGFAW